MQFKSFITAIVASATLFATQATLAHSEHGHPQYGGIYGEGGTFQAELVNGAKEISIYLTVHGEPLAAKGASAKLTVLAGSDKKELVLKPAGKNQLVIKHARLAPGSKVMATLQPEGKEAVNIRYSIE